MALAALAAMTGALTLPQVAGADAVGPTCPTVADPVLAELCATAEGGSIISSTEQPGATFEQPPASAGTSASGGFSITSTQSCTYYDTLYASGSGSGDHLYGYTTNLGAKASAHAHSAFPAVYQNRIAYVTMITGHRLQWNGDPVTVNGRVVMPWHEGGTISTATDTSFFATTNASGTMQYETGLLDETTGQQQTAIERTHLQSGQSSKVYTASGTRTYAITFQKGHIYRPYIKLDGSAQAQGTVFNPGLQADSLVDWLGGSNGAYMNYVRYEFDLPDGYSLTCG